MVVTQISADKIKKKTDILRQAKKVVSSIILRQIIVNGLVLNSFKMIPDIEVKVLIIKEKLVQKHTGNINKV